MPPPSYAFSPSELHAFALPGVAAELTDRLAATPGARARPATAAPGGRRRAATELPPTGEAAAAFFAAGGGSGEVRFVHLVRQADPEYDGGLRSAYELAVLPPEQSRFAEFVMSATGVVCHVDLAGASALHGGGDGGGGSSGVPPPAHFTPLAGWMREASLFRAVREINAFKHFLSQRQSLAHSMSGYSGRPLMEHWRIDDTRAEREGSA